MKRRTAQTIVSTKLMHDDRYFCALASQANNEMLCGTVARIRTWLLLEYPGVWRHDAVEDSRLLSPELKAHLRKLAVDRILFVRQGHQRDREFLRTFSVASDGPSPMIERRLIPDFEHLRHPSSAAERVDGLMFAVCTHARHDKCCAKFGMPVWCALRDLAPGRSWQCSHVGGDRFAANVLLFPYGIYYGRVRPEDVPELLKRSESGQIWLPGYRGRSCFTKNLQVADGLLRAESGRLGIEEFVPLGPAVSSADVTTVVFEARSDRSRHEIQFRTAVGSFRQRLTCAATEESSVPEYTLHSYRVVAA